MPRKNNMQDINVWQSSYTIDELQQMRRVLAKRANQRIVRLSRNKSLVTGELYDSYGAVDLVYDYLRKQRPEEGALLRFSERQHVDMTHRKLKKEISELQNFLNSKTSTVGGQKKAELLRIEAFEFGGISIATNKEFYNFMNSDVFTKALNGFDSAAIVDVYDKARKVTNKDGEEIYDDDKVTEIINEYIKQKDVDVKGLYAQFKLKPVTTYINKANR